MKILISLLIMIFSYQSHSYQEIVKNVLKFHQSTMVLGGEKVSLWVNKKLEAKQVVSESYCESSFRKLLTKVEKNKYEQMIFSNISALRAIRAFDKELMRTMVTKAFEGKKFGEILEKDPALKSVIVDLVASEKALDCLLMAGLDKQRLKVMGIGSICILIGLLIIGNLFLRKKAMLVKFLGTICLSVFISIVNLFWMYCVFLLEIVPFIEIFRKNYLG